MEYVKSFKELREELEKIAPPAILEEFDEYVKSGQKLHALKIIREYKINPTE